MKLSCIFAFVTTSMMLPFIMLYAENTASPDGAAVISLPPPATQQASLLSEPAATQPAEIPPEFRTLYETLHRLQQELTSLRQENEFLRSQLIQHPPASTQPATRPADPAPPPTPSPKTAATQPDDTGERIIQVKGYYRKDGTYVHPHTRKIPVKTKSTESE